MRKVFQEAFLECFQVMESLFPAGHGSVGANDSSSGMCMSEEQQEAARALMSKYSHLTSLTLAGAEYQNQVASATGALISFQKNSFTGDDVALGTASGTAHCTAVTAYSFTC